MTQRRLPAPISCTTTGNVRVSCVAVPVYRRSFAQQLFCSFDRFHLTCFSEISSPMRGGDGMLDSLSGRSRHRGEVFEGAAQACGGVVRAVRAQRGGRDPGAGVSQQGGVAHVVSRVAGGAAYGGSLEAWRALCEVHGRAEARCGGALPGAWQAVGQDDAPDGVSRP